MDFSEHNAAVIAIAADILGWTKSVNLKETAYVKKKLPQCTI